MTDTAVRTDTAMNQTNQGSFRQSIKEPVEKRYLPVQGKGQSDINFLYFVDDRSHFILPLAKANTEDWCAEETLPKQQPVTQQRKHQIDRWAEFETEYTWCEAKLMSFLELPNGWDGEEAVKPDPKHVYRLRRWMREFKAKPIPSPSPMIASSGEMALYWRNGGAYAELGIDENGKPYVLCKENGRIVIGMDECNSDGEALETIFDFVRKHFRDESVPNK